MSQYLFPARSPQTANVQKSKFQITNMQKRIVKTIALVVNHIHLGEHTRMSESCSNVLFWE